LGLVVFVLLASSIAVPGIAPTAHSAPPAAPSGTSRVLAPSGGSNGSFSVETTTVLANNTTLPGNFLASNGLQPDATAYDPTSSTLWVANGGSGTVSVINLTLGRMVATVPVGSDPVALLYDPGLDRVFVVNEYSYNVSAINATSFRPVGSVTVGLAPLALALDPALQTVFVAVSRFSLQAVLNGQPLENGSILAVNASTLQVVGNASLYQRVTTDVIYGPSGDLYAVSLGGCKVTTLDPANDSILGNVSLPAGSCGWGVDQQRLICPDVVSPLPGSATLAYDPSNGLLYVGVTNTATACVDSNSVEALNLTNDSWVYGRTVPFGGDSFGNSSLAQIAVDPEIPALLAEFSGNGTVGTLAALRPDGLSTIDIRAVSGTFLGLSYEPALHQVLWTDGLTGRVIRANSTSLDPTTRYAVGADPVALVAAPNLGGVAVAEYSQNSVLLLNATRGTVVGQWPVGFEPTALAYDPQTDEVAVANSGSGNLTILNLSLGTTVASVPIGGEPSGVAFDPASGSWWVADGSSGTVAEVSARTQGVLRVVPVNPVAILSGITFDPTTDSVAVGLLTNSTVAVLNATTGALDAQIPVGYAPASLVDVPSAGAIVVANAGSGNLSVISATDLDVTDSIPVSNLPLSITYDPAQGVVLAAQYGGDSLAVVNLETLSVRGFLAVGSGPSGVAVDPVTGRVFVANANSGTVSTVAVLGFSVLVTESGLPPHSTWWFNLTRGAQSSTSGSNLSLYLINGTYGYTVRTSTPGYASAPGFFIVRGRPITLQVSFARTTSPVSFDAVGLPSGLPWYVNLSGGFVGSTSGTSLIFNLTNGSYTYTVQTSDRMFAPTPGAGEFMVQGSRLGIEIRFAIVTSPIIFQATGLPNGTEWWVHAGREQFTARGPSMSVSLPNGTYRYTVGTVNLSYRAEAGSFTVDGTRVDVPINFQLVVFPVVIAESGLPNSTSWSVVVQGQTVGSSNGSVRLILPNGSYSFRVIAPSGYSVVPGTGTITVQGNSVIRVIAFSASGSPVPIQPYLLGGAAATALTAGAAILLFGRRRAPGARKG
jgi:YVTN family beta-propeller protein